MDHLFARVAAGDANARDELITALYESLYLRQRVYYRLRKLPSFDYLQDDLECVATLTLVKTIDAMLGKRIEKPTQYLNRAIDRAINDAIAEEQNRDYSASAQRKARARGETLACPTFETLTDYAEPENADDLFETILDCCEDDIDRQIIHLRRQGNTYDAVAEQIGMSRSAAQARCARIEERFDATLHTAA